MSQIELVQALQFFIILVIAIFFVYGIVRNYKFFWTFITEIKDCNCIGKILKYTRCLSIVNYVSYHKYIIWRYYLHSRENAVID
jgi:hypothetical protein